VCVCVCVCARVCACVCGKEKRQQRNCQQPFPLVSSHATLRAIINHLVGFIVWFTAHAQHLSDRAVAGGGGAEGRGGEGFHLIKSL